MSKQICRSGFRFLEWFFILSLAATSASAQSEKAAADDTGGEVPLKASRTQFTASEFGEFVTFQLSQPQPGGPQGAGRAVRTIHGQVVDHLGQPVAGALVSITEEIGFANESSYDNFDKTDELGRFVVVANFLKDHVVVRNARGESWIRAIRSDQTYVKFVWPQSSTLRLELDLKVCLAGKEFQVQSSGFWVGMDVLRIVRAQTHEGVTTFSLLPGSYRVLCPKRIQAGGFEVERVVEVARFTIGEGEERTLRVGPEAGIAVTNKSADGAKWAGGNNRWFAEIQTQQTQYQEHPVSVDIAPVAELGKFQARVLTSGHYVLEMKEVTPREGRLIRGQEPFEAQTIGQIRFEVKAGDKEIDVARLEKEDARTQTVKFVHNELESKQLDSPSAMSLSGSFHRMKARSIADYADHEGVAAELLRILNDPNSPYEWTYECCNALALMTEHEGVVEGILKLLDSPDRKFEQGQVMRTLENPQRMVPQVIDRLVVFTRDEKARMRAGAYVTLEQIGGKQEAYRERIAPIMVRGLADPYDNIRLRAAATLGWYKSGEEGPLRPLLADPDMSVRLAAARAISQIAGDDEPLVRLGTELLSHENLELRREAAYQLESLDKLPPETIAALRANLIPETRPPFRDREVMLRTTVSQAARRTLAKQGALTEEK